MLGTNIELDEKLVNEAMKLTHKKTKKALQGAPSAPFAQAHRATCRTMPRQPK